MNSRRHPIVRNRLMIVAAAAAVTVSLDASLFADTLASWNFNNDSTAPTASHPNLLATPSISLVGGTTATFASGSGSSDAVQPGRGYNTTSYPAVTSSNKSAGIRFNFNTTNFDISTFAFDWRTSNTSSRWLQLQYTTDGSSWTDAAIFSSTGGDDWNNNLAYDFSSTAGVDNNPNFAVRMVSLFSPNGFTQTTGGLQTYGPDQAYRAANADDRAYATTGTWRFDTVSLEGTYNSVVFNPTNLTWNTGSGTWDTVTSNKPWLNPTNQASAFAQAGGFGDNVTFNNPAANSVVTIQAGGVTPNSTTITNSSTLTFTGGAISGTGGLVKNGSGRLILASSNSFTSAQGPTQINAGTVETRAGSGLGTGTVSIGNATWHATTAAQSSPGVVNLTGPVTIQTDVELALTNGMSGTGVFTKTGAATLAIAGVSSNVGTMTINAGTVRMDAVGALGGNASTGTAVGTLQVNGATVIVNATGNNSATRNRLSSDVVLNNGTISRAQLTVGLGPAPTNGDSEFTSYTTGGSPALVGGTFIVNGSSTLANLETRTAAASDTPGGGGSDNAMVVRMPTVVTTGSTLTMFAANGTLSTVGGLLTGDLDDTSACLRGTTTDVNPNDSVTLKPGASLVMSGPGEKRIGSGGNGKPIVGLGTSGSEAVLRADAHTFMTDLANIDAPNTLLVVAGSGNGGLRVEAPMNASYSADPTIFSTTGLFGANPGEEGNNYTVLSPNRYAGLSSGGPTVAADGTPIVRGGVLTIAATDAAGATGTIDNGPAAATPVKLGLDNAAASGALVYNIDAAANSGAFENFGGLVLKKSFAGPVTGVLLAPVTKVGSLDVTGGAKLDVVDKDMIVGSATPMSQVEGYVASARTGGTWTGAGVTSSTAAANATTGIGVISGAEYTSVGGSGQFDGHAYSAGDTLVKYTWNGDANFSGTVSFDDYVKIDTGFNQHLTGWLNGDFNYSGAVTFDDYVLIDIAFNQQNGTLGRAVDWISGDDRSAAGLDSAGMSEVLGHLDQFGGAYGAAFLAAVPEPTSMLVLSVPGALGFIRRRRSR